MMTGSEVQAPRRNAAIVVARRLDDMQSGSSQYLKTYLDICERAGLATTIVFAPRRSFGNVAWAKIHPDILNRATGILWGRTVRFRGYFISTTAEVWWRCLKRIAKEIIRRLRHHSNTPLPSLLGATLEQHEVAEVLEQLDALKPQLVTAEYSSIAPILDHCTDARRVVFLHDLFSLRAENFRAQGQTPDHVEITREEEALRCKSADLIVHASCTELAHFEQVLPQAEHIWMRPGVRAIAEHTNPQQTPHAVFIGSMHAGNVAGLAYLRDQVWPLVRAKCPDAELHIVGSIAKLVSAAEAAEEGLRLIGQVDDLASVAGPHAIGLAPAQIGSGIPIKIVDYLSLNMSIVSTKDTMAAFGGALHGIVLEASSDVAFAEIVIRLLSEKDARARSHVGHKAINSRLDNGPLQAALTASERARV